VDGLIVQGVEAGGHRGGFDDSAPGDVGLLALLQLVRAALADLPLVATGGIATGGAVAAVLAAGAAAAQLGTAFTLCPEAATVPAHRVAITDGSTGTAVTRAFTGRAATPTAFTSRPHRCRAAPQRTQLKHRRKARVEIARWSFVLRASSFGTFRPAHSGAGPTTPERYASRAASPGVDSADWRR